MVSTWWASRGSKPALTNDDFPQPDGPEIKPTVKVSSGSVSSIRDFQKRTLSGKPSRSRAPGNSSRKKSASFASKDRSPLGTIRIMRLSEGGRGDDSSITVGGAGNEIGVGGKSTGSTLRDSVPRKWVRSCAKSLAVV